MVQIKLKTYPVVDTAAVGMSTSSRRKSGVQKRLLRWLALATITISVSYSAHFRVDLETKNEDKPDRWG